mmetsp:Transcript_40546/g.106470  ORF Transcript_40546/g.106470 Transcript_40546/m.106470 type:complete len:200 (+) Transcript_40546:1536-2135(+)
MATIVSRMCAPVTVGRRRRARRAPPTKQRCAGPVTPGRGLRGRLVLITFALAMVAQPPLERAAPQRVSCVRPATMASTWTARRVLQMCAPATAAQQPPGRTARCTTRRTARSATQGTTRRVLSALPTSAPAMAAPLLWAPLFASPTVTRRVPPVSRASTWRRALVSRMHARARAVRQLWVWSATTTTRRYALAAMRGIM